MLVLIRVPVDQSPPVPLKPAQALRLPLGPGAAVSFGRGRDCTVRTDGPGVQATLEADAAGTMTLAFLGSMPAPCALVTRAAPHGLRVVTPSVDEFRGGQLFSRVKTMVQVVTGQHTLKVGDTIVFTLHAAPRTCFMVAKAAPAPAAAATKTGKKRKAGADEAGTDQAAADEPARGGPSHQRAAALMPGFDARRIFLRDGANATATQPTDSATLDFSKCAAAAQPSPTELAALAAKVGSGDLCILNLANNNLSTEGVLALARELGQASCVLEGLNVRGNWSTIEDDEVDPQTGVALAAALHPLEHRSSLTTLDAGGNSLWGAEVGAAFAAALRAPSCSLVALDLQGCAIGDMGAAALTAALRGGSGLTSLGVGWNNLSTAASTALAEALQSPACQLTRLGHWRNNLQEAGGLAIAAALVSPHCCLTELDVGWNDIGPQAGLAIAEALASSNCKLTKLVAGNNAFGSEAGKAFARLLGSATSRLEHLAIHMNGFGPEAGGAFAERMPLLLTSLGACDANGGEGGGGCALTELFLNANALGLGSLQLFANHLRAATQGSRGPRMALLHLRDNGPSQAEVEGLMSGVECVEALLL